MSGASGVEWGELLGKSLFFMNDNVKSYRDQFIDNFLGGAEVFIE